MSSITNDKAAYNVYIKFLSLKTHFNNSEYDYFSYNGKIKTSIAAFNRRADKYFFYKLSKHSDSTNWLLANFVNDENFWIGNDSCNAIYTAWLKRKESRKYLYKTNLEQLENLSSSISVPKNGECPKLLWLFLNGQVCPETMVILDQLFHIISLWDKKLYDIIWEKYSKKLTKYSPFVIIDGNQYMDLTKDIFLHKHYPNNQ